MTRRPVAVAFPILGNVVGTHLVVCPSFNVTSLGTDCIKNMRGPSSARNKSMAGNSMVRFFSVPLPYPRMPYAALPTKGCALQRQVERIVGKSMHLDVPQGLLAALLRSPRRTGLGIESCCSATVQNETCFFVAGRGLVQGVPESFSGALALGFRRVCVRILHQVSEVFPWLSHQLFGEFSESFSAPCIMFPASFSGALASSFRRVFSKALAKVFEELPGPFGEFEQLVICGGSDEMHLSRHAND